MGHLSFRTVNHGGIQPHGGRNIRLNRWVDVCVAGAANQHKKRHGGHGDQSQESFGAQYYSTDFTHDHVPNLVCPFSIVPITAIPGVRDPRPFQFRLASPALDTGCKGRRRYGITLIAPLAPHRRACRIMAAHFCPLGREKLDIRYTNRCITSVFFGPVLCKYSYILPSSLYGQAPRSRQSGNAKGRASRPGSEWTWERAGGITKRQGLGRRIDG